MLICLNDKRVQCKAPNQTMTFCPRDQIFPEGCCFTVKRYKKPLEPRQGILLFESI